MWWLVLIHPLTGSLKQKFPTLFYKKLHNEKPRPYTCFCVNKTFLIRFQFHTFPFKYWFVLENIMKVSFNMISLHHIRPNKKIAMFEINRPGEIIFCHTRPEFFLHFMPFSSRLSNFSGCKNVNKKENENKNVLHYHNHWAHVDIWVFVVRDEILIDQCSVNGNFQIDIIRALFV